MSLPLLIQPESRIVLLKKVLDECNIKSYEILKTFKGSEFLGTTCTHPFEKMNFNYVQLY